MFKGAKDRGWLKITSNMSHIAGLLQIIPEKTICCDTRLGSIRTVKYMLGRQSTIGS